MILKKILIAAVATMSLTSFAQEFVPMDSESLDLQVSGSVEAGCVFLGKGNFVSFGIVKGFTIPEAQTSIQLLCTQDLPYTVTTEGSISDENLKMYFNVYKDSNHTTFLNTENPIEGVGNSTIHELPVYLTATSNIGAGELVETGYFTASIPVTVVY